MRVGTLYVATRTNEVATALLLAAAVRAEKAYVGANITIAAATEAPNFTRLSARSG